MKIVPFKYEHALEILVRDHDADLKENENFRKWAEMNVMPGMSYTGLYEGRPVMCAGVRTLWPGVGEAWILLSPEIVNFKKEMYYTVIQYLEKIIKENGLWRVQAHARTDVPVAVRFLEHLGFEREGLMRKFDPQGRDCFLYALVKE